MKFAPETIEEVKERQFAVVHGFFHPSFIHSVARSIRWYALACPDRAITAGEEKRINITQYDIANRSRLGRLLVPKLVEAGQELGEAVRASGINDQVADWGRNKTGSNFALLANLFGVDGEFTWHRDIARIRGVVAILSAEGEADAYVSAASERDGSMPPQRVVDVDPISLHPGDVLLMDMTHRPWHRIVNATPDNGMRSSLAAAQIYH